MQSNESSTRNTIEGGGNLILPGDGGFRQAGNAILVCNL